MKKILFIGLIGAVISAAAFAQGGGKGKKGGGKGMIADDAGCEVVFGGNDSMISKCQGACGSKLGKDLGRCLKQSGLK